MSPPLTTSIYLDKQNVNKKVYKNATYLLTKMQPRFIMKM